MSHPMARLRLLRLMMALCAATLAAGAASGEGSGPDRAAYRKEIEAWRQAREESLKADGGWLTVAGLYWLEAGDNRFGSDPACEIVLPAGSAPAQAGVFTLRDARVSVRMNPGVAATAGGKPVEAMEMRSDATDDPDVLALDALTLQVIDRGGRLGIRLKDMNSRFRKQFTGLHWYPVKARYRVEARFVPYEAARTMPIPTILGTTEPMLNPGYVLFDLHGSELRLEALQEGPDEDLFFIFHDRTSGRQTYPAGRFLHADRPVEGVVVLDFNRAYNPPCAFTPYATCPLPPLQNRLPVRIEAGELDYGHHRP